MRRVFWRLKIAFGMCLVMSLCACSSPKVRDDQLPSWNGGADSAKESIISYVEEVTDESSDYYIPEEDRVAAFDMDGTILQEVGAVLNHQVAAAYYMEYRRNDLKLAKPSIGQIFEGLSEDDIAEYVALYVEKEKQVELKGRTFEEAFYQPMVELIQYLDSKNFEIYIVSGSDRAVVWGALEGYNHANPENRIPVDRAHMIGTEPEVIVTSSKEDITSIEFMPDQKLVRTDTMKEGNVGIMKVSRIYQQCGKLPVIAVGNSSGDYEMLNMAKSSPYKSLSLLLTHDDSREAIYGGGEQVKNLCTVYDWTWISMKKEFETIYL